jgi:feruloyl-CoA synthase
MKLGLLHRRRPVRADHPAYSLMSSDHAKLKHCWTTVRPKVVFAQSGAQFAPALAVLRTLDPEIAVVTVDGEGGVPFSKLTKTPAGPEVAAAMERLGHPTVAKYLFTSGSTACPRACRRPTA